MCVALRHQWSDGTTHLRLDPITFLERLAVLIPRPRINLVLYHGVLAPRAPWRAAVAASGRRRGGGYLWAELMRRTFGIDVLECSRCGGRLRLMALTEHAQIVGRILRHLGLPTDRPEPRPPRTRPLRGDDHCQFDPAADAAFWYRLGVRVA